MLPGLVVPASRVNTRRSLLAMLVVCGLARPRWAAAAIEDPVFDATSFDEVLRRLGSTPVTSAQLQLDLPDAVENGALVPVTLSSLVPGTTELAIVVELNPNPMAARFVIPSGTEPWLSTRIKVAESGQVFAIARAGGRLYSTSRSTQVTIGGCA